MDAHTYKFRRVVTTVIIFLALTVLSLLVRASSPILWGILIAAIAELLNDLRG